MLKYYTNSTLCGIVNLARYMIQLQIKLFTVIYVNR